MILPSSDGNYHPLIIIMQIVIKCNIPMIKKIELDIINFSCKQPTMFPYTQRSTTPTTK
jgi:hypothetical protein